MGYARVRAHPNESVLWIRPYPPFLQCRNGLPRILREMIITLEIERPKELHNLAQLGEKQEEAALLAFHDGSAVEVAYSLWPSTNPVFIVKTILRYGEHAMP